MNETDVVDSKIKKKKKEGHSPYPIYFFFLLVYRMDFSVKDQYSLFRTPSFLIILT